jgi:hypothetical protein
LDYWDLDRMRRVDYQLMQRSESLYLAVFRLSATYQHARVPWRGGAQANIYARPARPSADVVTAAVLAGYRIQDEKTLCSRAHQEAFQGWVYLLRRALNLPLQEVAKRGKVSPLRI